VITERNGLRLLALCLANFMATLDLFVVNVALRDIGAHFGGSALSNVSWVLNAYAIVFGAFLIPAGRIADRLGRKGVFIAGLVIFTLASVACAVSPSFWALIAFRCGQAIGAALLVPSSLGLVLTTMPAEKVLSSVRIWAVSGAIAGIAGPVVGGLLTQADWRLIFLINLPIGVAAIAATVRVVPAIAHDVSARIPDPLESLLIVVGIGALSLGLIKGPDWGWTDDRVTGSWIVAFVAGAAFRFVNHHSSAPVVDRNLFRSRAFRLANLAMILATTPIAMELLGLSLLLQQSWHWSALATGAAVAPAPAATFVAARLGPSLFPRLAAGRMAAIGFVMLAAGQALMIVSLQGGTSDYVSAILPGWILIGFGGGLVVPTLTGLATANLPTRDSASASAIVQMARQLGSVLGTAVLIAILGHAVATGARNRFLDAWWVAGTVFVVGALLALAITPDRPSHVSSQEEGPAEAAPIAWQRAIALTRCPGSVLVQDMGDACLKTWETTVAAGSSTLSKARLVIAVLCSRAAGRLRCPGAYSIRSAGHIRYRSGGDDLQTRRAATKRRGRFHSGRQFDGTIRSARLHHIGISRR
jgi:EmrB/QacA subfamily drug resistance transporter